MLPPESFTLHGTSVRIPSRGLGTFQPDPKQYPEGSVKQSVLRALQVGYRHIDTALAYGWGSVEQSVGEAIKESGVPREEIFVVTKLHQCFHKPEDVEVGMDISLKNLGLDFVPYAYVTTENYGTQRHPSGKPVLDIPMSKAYDMTWEAMERLVQKGKTKMIGVSNFSTPKLRKLMSTARIHPAVNQIELNPYFPQKSLFRFCQANNIHVTAFGPLGSKPIPILAGRHGPGPLEDPVIATMATKYSKTPAQLILNFLLNRGVSVIPKSNEASRIEENFDCLFRLDPADFSIIDDLMGVEGEKGVRNIDSRDYLGFDNFNEEVEEP